MDFVIVILVSLVAVVAFGVSGVLILWPINDKPTSNGQYATFFLTIVFISYTAIKVSRALIN